MAKKHPAKSKGKTTVPMGGVRKLPKNPKHQSSK